MSDDERKLIIKGEFRLEPDSLQALVEGLVEGVAERLDRRPSLPEEAATMPKAFIVGHKVIVPRLNGFAPIAEKIAQFSRLEEASKDVAVYRLNRVSLWKAAELGLAPDEVIEILKAHSPTLPLKSLRNMISRTMSLYGALLIEAEKNYNVLRAVDKPTMDRILAYRDVSAHIYRRLDDTRTRIVSGRRAEIKRLLMDKGYPVKDYGLMEEFAPLEIAWRPEAEKALWDHQKKAIERFLKMRNGVVILPPGSGKTRIAVGATVKLKAPTLFITNKAHVCEQTKDEYLKTTNIQSYDIAVIHGGTNERFVKPVTLTTYQMLTAASRGRSSRLVRDIWKTRWGLIVCDEVQHLPAEVWRHVAEDLQSKRKMGLTATPVREDKQEKDIFSLIGPPVIDINWLEMEDEGVISGLTAYEVLVGMSQSTRRAYNSATTEWGRIMAATDNPEKFKVVKELLKKHENDQVLIIGYYVEQATNLAHAIGAEIIFGSTPHSQRSKLYQSFREGGLKKLVLTSVGEEGIDLPNANVGISIASLFGSRMGFSQKVGRILRTHEDKETAIFYEVATEGTVEQDYSERRREYLIGQGYDFDTIDLTGMS